MQSLPRKSAVRFKERSDLLDFLLEVSAVTSQTLDLDQLLGNVAEIVQRVLRYDLFAILLYNERRRDLRLLAARHLNSDMNFNTLELSFRKFF